MGVISTDVDSSCGKAGDDAPDAVISRSRRLEINFAIFGDSAAVSVPDSYTAGGTGCAGGV